MRILSTIATALLWFVTAAAAQPPPVVYPTGTSGSIGRSIEVLEDPNADLTPAQAWEADGYRPSPNAVPNMNVSRSAHWLRFHVENGSSEPRLTLSIPYAEIDELDIYMRSDDGLRPLAVTGRTRENRERVAPEREFVFDIPLPPGASAGMLIRVRGFKPIHVPVMVSSQASFGQVRAKRNILLGVYAGIMLALTLYNLFIFLATRDRSYFLYVLYIPAICFAQLSFLGIGPFDILDAPAWLNARASIFFALIAVVLGMEFARRFIGTKTLTPKLHRIVPVFFVLVFLNMLLYAFGDPWVGYQVAQAITGWTAIYLLVLGIVALRRGSRQAGFFLVAWTMFLLGVVVFVLKDADVLPFNAFTQHAMPIGSAIEGILLSFGLADRINVLRREKERSQAEALAASVENERIIREQNVILEEKVTERTHALQESNEHLKRTQTQLVNAEKMASLGQLTAGIAHEINNPINFITSNITPLRRNISEIVEVMQGYRSLEPAQAADQLRALKERERELGIQDSIEELDDIIGSIAEGSSRTAEIVRGLRNFSRLDEDDLKDADLNEGLRNTLTVLGPQYRDKVRFEFGLGDLPRVECFPGKVNQVFMNVLTNAVQAALARNDGTEPTVRLATMLDGDHVTVRISDNGIGMSDEVKSRMYDPFFTTKDVGEGTGLGLAIAYGIVQDHHGTIEADSVPGEGTEFRITLPVRHPRSNEQRA